MIRQLMREQLRSHRAYVIWTTALLTLAVGLASYAAFVAMQSQVGVSAGVRSAYGLDGAWRGSAIFYEADAADDPAQLTWEQVRRAMADSTGDGSHATAVMPLDIRGFVSTPTELAAAGGYPWDAALVNVAAMTGDVSWGALLLTGDAPREGEIAVDAHWADANHVSIGDAVQLSTIAWDGEQDSNIELGRLIVSGTLRTSLPSRYGTYLYDGIVGWDSVPALAATAQAASAAAGSHNGTLMWQVSVSADRQTPALALFSTSAAHLDYYGTAIDPAAVVLAIAAGVLVLGLIGMAFAVGRAQAQVRTRWVATARVLGARRSSIVGATLLEVGAIGTLAAAVGVGTAYALFASDWARVVAANPDALAWAAPSVPWWVACVLSAAAVLVAGILGAVPAFWAARVAPAAALKPVTPVSEAQVSRTVPLWPLLVIWGPLALFTVLSVKVIVGNGAWGGGIDASGGFRIAAVLVGVGAAVTSTMLLVELSRRATAFTTRRLARGSRPWQIAASSALADRPRQASGPASVLAVASAVAVGSMTWLALAEWIDVGPGEAAPGPFAVAASWGWGDGTTQYSQAVIIVTFGVLSLAALAAQLVARAGARAEADAQAALGLSRSDARLAAAAQFALPLATSVAVGALTGLVAALVLFTRTDWSGTWSGPVGLVDATVSGSSTFGSAWAVTHLGHAVPLLLQTVAIALAGIAVGALVVAATARASARSLTRTRG
ncbi:hypothetical protein RN607_01210 [Demequina capsici]|uniref:FtsX-like permease family protein n=1 Tax=Demequina capsici TaxID=3075620 RepID=A0AA96FC69_9MICO|nr:hypothetical protein [Demequina sp. PMTSA13]WNM27654.1 hypothetical protein RN607_01210 [Demequina sp. PMTSA13]